MDFAYFNTLHRRYADVYGGAHRIVSLYLPEIVSSFLTTTFISVGTLFASLLSVYLLCVFVRLVLQPVCGVKRHIYFVGKDEQLVVRHLRSIRVYNGPIIKILLPCTFRHAQKRIAYTLKPNKYMTVQDRVKGTLRIEVGPKKLYLGKHDVDPMTIQDTVVLRSLEYFLSMDKSTGKKTIVRGPGQVVPGPFTEGVIRAARTLSPTQCIRVTDKLTGNIKIVKGPCCWFPEHAYEEAEAESVAAAVLESIEYVVVKDWITGEKTVVRGPCTWFPGPTEVVWEHATVHTLSDRQYIIVQDTLTGMKSIVKGPCSWVPKPHDLVEGTYNNAIALAANKFAVVKDNNTHERWVERGKQLLFLQPSWSVELTRSAYVLKSYQYVRLFDTSTGQVNVYRGESIVFPKATEVQVDSGVCDAIDLKVNQYIKVLDAATGQIRVRRGPELEFLGAHEKIVGSKRSCYNVDSKNAVLVLDKSTGQQRLVTEHGLFVPGPTESVLEVRKLIKLDKHEAMILEDQHGSFTYYFGDSGKNQNPSQFFIPPHHQIRPHMWSRGARRNVRDLKIECLDMRPQYMWFEFNCHTADNVELVLEGSFFWQVVDMPRMVRMTGDTAGDLCAHARSRFIKHVAQVTLAEFMENISIIANKVYEEDAIFFETRGVKVSSLEVTDYRCAAQNTSEVLQQIIQETTNRMNRLSKQESETEVNVFRIHGQMEQANLKRDLLTIQHQQKLEVAEVAGKSAARLVSGFMKGLAEDVPKREDRILMWQTLRKNEALHTLSDSTGGASIYFTPSDVGITITGTKRW